MRRALLRKLGDGHKRTSPVKRKKKGEFPESVQIPSDSNRRSARMTLKCQGHYLNAVILMAGRFGAENHGFRPGPGMRKPLPPTGVPPAGGAQEADRQVRYAK
ncbi:hypothetical protein GCM10017750_05270 [Streptomyces racemochromogenes]